MKECYRPKHYLLKVMILKLVERGNNIRIVQFGDNLGGFPKHHSDSVAVKGTIGYVAPEYGMGDMVSTQGDVYSFGILLLEMFTSKKPTDDAFKDDLSLHNYVKSCMADNVMEIVDPYILLKHGTTSEIKDCMISILRIGVACSVELPRDRMEMREMEAQQKMNYPKCTSPTVFVVVPPSSSAVLLVF
ncbi:hypothetical protein F0562_028258 [Nyssa sinensis]|uniref:Protein kinase domain-containing protein n=1 Tax=Nyssa sinensis TaxID=561372 RepID=A0A5J5B861_9ASTE|nr:hypothetical protein F0562_028258 [Nyssa sinensis]